jgi:hypothetical protein
LHAPGFRQDCAEEPRDGRGAQRAGIPLACPGEDVLLALRVAQVQLGGTLPSADRQSQQSALIQQLEQLLVNRVDQSPPLLDRVLHGVPRKIKKPRFSSESRPGWKIFSALLGYSALSSASHSRQPVRSAKKAKERQVKANLCAKVIGFMPAEITGAWSLGKERSPVNGVPG